MCWVHGAAVGDMRAAGDHGVAVGGCLGSTALPWGSGWCQEEHGAAVEARRQLGCHGTAVGAAK